MSVPVKNLAAEFSTSQRRLKERLLKQVKQELQQSKIKYFYILSRS